MTGRIDNTAFEKNAELFNIPHKDLPSYGAKSVKNNIHYQ